MGTSQLRPTATPGDAADRNGNGLLLAHQNDKPFTASKAGIEQITLQHGVVLRHERNHHRRVFRSLALMDGRRIGRYQGVKVAEPIGDRTVVEPGDELAIIRFNGESVGNTGNCWRCNSLVAKVLVIKKRRPDLARTPWDLKGQFAASAGAMSASFAVVPWPPATVAPVMLCLRSASPTATVAGLRPIGPRGEMRSVTHSTLSLGR
jgi:hypothetical protein